MEEMTRPLTGDAEAVTRTGEPTPDPFVGEVMLTPAKEKAAMKRNNMTDKNLTNRLQYEGILWRLCAPESNRWSTLTARVPHFNGWRPDIELPQILVLVSG
jgi:hypothetical protein